MPLENIESSKIGFAGLSHLGIVSSVCWSSLGFQIVGVDGDRATVSALDDEQLPIHEPKLPELLKANRTRLTFTERFEALAGCSVVYITLDVETDETHRPLLDGLNQLVDSLVPWLSQEVTLVVMSQVPVGYCRNLAESVRKSRPDLDFELYHWVETLVIGDGVDRCLHPERIILGGDSSDKTLPPALESILSAFSCPMFRMSYESAELTKAAVNACLSASVSIANVLADLCEVTGASMGDIIPALRSDRRIGQYAYLRPGLGIAGGNLERDLRHLQRLGAEHGAPTGLLDQILADNAVRYRWVQRQITKHIVPVSPAPTLAFWGLSYKKDTESTRNSFSVRILRELAGKMELRAYDPIAQIPEDLQTSVSSCDRLAAVDGADCLLVLTDWDEFSDTDFKIVGERMRSRAIIDCVGVLNRKTAVDQGFRYISIGNPNEQITLHKPDRSG